MVQEAKATAEDEGRERERRRGGRRVIAVSAGRGRLMGKTMEDSTKHRAGTPGSPTGRMPARRRNFISGVNIQDFHGNRRDLSRGVLQDEVRQLALSYELAYRIGGRGRR